MNTKKTLQNKTTTELVEETLSLAQSARSNNRLGESYIIESNANLIIASARNEKAVTDLIQTLKEFNKEASTQTQKLINLTWAIVILTILMLVGLIVQIIKS